MSSQLSPERPQIRSILEDGAIDGGDLSKGPEADKNEKVHVIADRPDDVHRRFVTLALIAVLAFVVIGHYLVLLLMEWNGKKVESLNTAFNTSLPVVSGLVASAVTYYFTRAKS